MGTTPPVWARSRVPTPIFRGGKGADSGNSGLDNGAEWCHNGGMEEIRVTLRIPKELYEWAKARAKRERRSLNAELVEVIERGLAEEEFVDG